MPPKPPTSKTNTTRREGTTLWTKKWGAWLTSTMCSSTTRATPDITPTLSYSSGRLVSSVTPRCRRSSPGVYRLIRLLWVSQLPRLMLWILVWSAWPTWGLGRCEPIPSWAGMLASCYGNIEAIQAGLPLLQPLQPSSMFTLPQGCPPTLRNSAAPAHLYPQTSSSPRINSAIPSASVG